MSLFDSNDTTMPKNVISTHSKLHLVLPKLTQTTQRQYSIGLL